MRSRVVVVGAVQGIGLPAVAPLLFVAGGIESLAAAGAGLLVAVLVVAVVRDTIFKSLGRPSTILSYGAGASITCTVSRPSSAPSSPRAAAPSHPAVSTLETHPRRQAATMAAQPSPPERGSD